VSLFVPAGSVSQVKMMIAILQLAADKNARRRVRALCSITIVVKFSGAAEGFDQ
jgi:hypothetical protein